MTTIEVKSTEMINKLFIPELADIILSYYIEPNEHKLYKRIVQEIKHHAYETMFWLNHKFTVNYDVDQNIPNITSHWGKSYEYWCNNKNYGYHIMHHNHDVQWMLDQIRNPEYREPSDQKYLRAIWFQWDNHYTTPLALALRKNFINRI